MKKSVLLVSMFSKDEVPYSLNYTDILKDNEIDYNIIYWNRNKNSELYRRGNEFFFNVECKTGGRKIRKFHKMLKYAITIRKLAKLSQYTHVIVLSTIPGIFLFDILLKKYKKRYIFDIRDYTHEKNCLYYMLEKKIILNSKFTTISSKGFEVFLPETSYVVTHNISNVEDSISRANEIKSKDKYVIGFVGNVRYATENIKLIEWFSEDEKFNIEYWGNTTNDFKLMKQFESTKVKFHGAYKNSDKRKIYEKIDFINAIYGSEGLEVTTAIPNRLYDAVIFKKPIITSKYTYLGQIVEDYDLGIVVDIYNEDVRSIIEAYAREFDADFFTEKCNTYLAEVSEEQVAFIDKIKKFLLED